MAKRPGMPDRPIKPTRGRAVDYHLRLSEEEFANFTDAATQFGIGLADWLRYSGRCQRERQKETAK